MSDVNQAPRGQQYGQRERTEERLSQIPMPDGRQVEPAPGGGRPRRDPREAAADFNPPLGLMGAPDEELDTALAGLPMPSAPTRQMPQANREALSLLPMMPTLERVARRPNTSPAFRRWFAAVKATIPPDATVRDLL